MSYLTEEKTVFVFGDDYTFRNIEIDEDGIANYDDDPHLPEITGGERRHLEDELIKACNKDLIELEVYEAQDYAEGKAYFATAF